MLTAMMGCRHDGELELDAVVDRATLLEERTVLCCHSGRLPLQDLMSFESSVIDGRFIVVSKLDSLVLVRRMS